MFQSTHPHGVRPNVVRLALCGVEVSIHAPAWGATPSTILLETVSEVSIHAPAWGATSDALLLNAERLGFNPRTRMGCDLWWR